MTEEAKIQAIADEAFDALKDVPPERLLPVMIREARKYGFRNEEKALKAALWRLRLRRVSFGLLGQE